MPTRPRLTNRELEIVDLIDRGLSNKEIARHLCIEVPTVKNHVHRILDKLQLGGRAEAAARVRANQGQSLVRLRADRSRI
jgi:two-component system nitrate/nitrite response regulator NarL